LAAGLGTTALATGQSVPYPTYVTGPQPNGSWVVGNGQVITPAGIQVDLGIRVRAKAIALNPNFRTHTAAVLTLGASQAVEVFDTNTGAVLQNYVPFGSDSSGSYSGITYSADGKQLLFSQDSSNVTVAQVNDQGLLADEAQINVPPDPSFITCFPNSPLGPYARPCATFYSPWTSYPGGVALSKDGNSAYALLNQNNTLTKIDLTAKPPQAVQQIRVGNAPHSIVINNDGATAYISNEGGRAATEKDFQIYSAGTEIVADPVVGAAITGTVSVVNLPSMQITNTISTGLHPTGMAFYGKKLLVANAYSDTISVIDTTALKTMGTILVGSRPRESAFTPDGARAFVTAEIGGVVSVIDAAKSAVVATLKLDRPTPPKPKGVVVHPNGKWVYVANGGSNDVAVIEVEPLRVAAFIPVGTRPWGLGITKDGKKLYVANGVSDTVSVIDTAAQKVVATIPVDKMPWGIAVAR